MMKLSYTAIVVSIVLFSAASAVIGQAGTPEVLRVATWNIEHFMKMFDQAQMPDRSREMSEFYRDQEDLYEVARTLKLENFNPDILGIIECCNEEMLKRFNEQWLGGIYQYVRVFPGNTDGQFLGLLMKPGFAVLEVRDQYYLETDPENDPRIASVKESAGLAEKNLLFCRGPVFVLVRTPGGKPLWIGVTHVKSKSGNNPAVTNWRIREIERTRQICGELLLERKTENLLMMGDFNDDFGMDRFEKLAQKDAVAEMIKGKEHEKLLSLTDALIQDPRKPASYHCEIKPSTYRSLIDHMFASPSLAKSMKSVYLVDDPIAAVASDHYPLVCDFEFSTVSK